jgi:hypothetical protein
MTGIKFMVKSQIYDWFQRHDKSQISVQSQIFDQCIDFCL